MLGTELDPVRLVVDVEDALLDLVVDLPGGVDEGLLHVGGGLGRGLHEDEPVLPGKRLTFLPFHISSSLQVTGEIENRNKDQENLMARPLVAYEHDHHVAVAVLPSVLQPCGLCGRE